MILFIKHILRDIKRNPLQPVLIILTLILSVSCAVTAFCSEKLFRDHATALSQEKAALGDIIISVGSGDTRLLFDSDAKDALGDSASVLGDFKLTGLKSDDRSSFISISATDLLAADRYFEFYYTEYGKFTAANLSSSAIISKNFAQNNGYGIGDTVSFILLGKEFTYTVEAIADNKGLLASSDMLISIDGVIGSIAAEVPSVSAVSGIITPYTRLLIKANESSDTDAIFEKLKAVPEFSGYNIEITDRSTQKEYLFMVQLGSVWLISSIIILLAAILTGTSQRLLESKRRVQYAAFSAAGATKKQINLLRYSEGFIYSLIGAVGGIALAVLQTKKVGSLFEWNESVLTVGVYGIIFGALFSPLLILACTAIHISRQKELSLSEQMFTEDSEKLTGETVNTRSAVITFSLLAITLGAILLVPASKRYIPAIIAILILIRCAYAFTPSIIRLIAEAFEKLLSRSKKCRCMATLNAKSFKNRFALKHVTRLMLILITLILSVNLCRTAIGTALSSINTMVTADTAIIGTNSVISDMVKNNPSVASAANIGIFQGTELPMGYTLTSISVKGDVEDCINKDLAPSRFPSGKEAVISKGLSKLLNVKEGDTIKIKITGVEYELTVCEVVDSGINTVLIDADGLGLGYNAVCFNFTESANADEIRKNELISKLEANGASIVESKYLFGTAYDTADGFLSLIEYATAACIILAIAGCINTLAAFYRSRRREFLILRLSGMRRSTLYASIFFEILTVLTVAFILSVPIYCATSFLIDTVLGSFGFSVFV